MIEALAGKALGARDYSAFTQAVRRSTILALLTAIILSLLLLFAGHLAIALLTDLEQIRTTAAAYSGYAAVYVLVSFAAFQLDGIFIGVSFTREMRQAAIYSLAVFLLAMWLLIGPFGLQGLWLAMIVYVIARALALLWYYPAILHAMAARET